MRPGEEWIITLTAVVLSRTEIIPVQIKLIKYCVYTGFPSKDETL